MARLKRKYYDEIVPALMKQFNYTTVMQVPKLGGYNILPYSAGQMITPDEQLQNGSDSYESSQLRRIEIRVRRKQ